MHRKPVTFTGAEMQFFKKGLKYNLHYKHKDWIKTLVIKADTGVSQLHERDQYMRQLLANNIKKP
jgi:hypothetical protein